MGETRRSFDPEFRAGAVRIVRETGRSIAQVAKDLGINAGTLANRVQMDRLAREQRATGDLSESERGSEYWAARFQAACRHRGVMQSMGRVGCALDNAAAESLNSTREAINRPLVRQQAEATREHPGRHPARRT
ncbi:transposase [Streptosporangium sp. NPDC048865]|uniref:transposase n=1 Tax=Streptosporangium sp. NPDC048865 TaxID=3155766 RepID=UPI00344AF041